MGAFVEEMVLSVQCGSKHSIGYVEGRGDIAERRS